MSAHKFTQSAVSTARPQKRTPRQRQERDAIIRNHGVKQSMKTRCTAENCPHLGELHDQYRIAQNERRFADATALWARIQAHECKGGA